MDRVADPTIDAARQILGLAREHDTGFEHRDDAVREVLETFYALAQLTPHVRIPSSVVDALPRPPATSTDDPGSDGTAARQTKVPGRKLRHNRSRMRTLAHTVLTARIRVPVPAFVMLTVALVLSLAANVLLPRAGEFRPEAAVHLTGTDSSPSARAVLLTEGSRIIVYASGLAELADGYRYVAWTNAGSQYRYLGSLTMLSTDTARLITTSDELVSAVVITIEPSTVPALPAGPRVLVGNTAE